MDVMPDTNNEQPLVGDGDIEAIEFDDDATESSAHSPKAANKISNKNLESPKKDSNSKSGPINSNPQSALARHTTNIQVGQVIF